MLRCDAIKSNENVGNCNSNSIYQPYMDANNVILTFDTHTHTDSHTHTKEAILLRSNFFSLHFTSIFVRSSRS